MRILKALPVLLYCMPANECQLVGFKMTSNTRFVQYVHGSAYTFDILHTLQHVLTRSTGSTLAPLFNSTVTVFIKPLSAA